MGRVGRRPTGTIEAATGERIVAFGRAGKPSENPFFRVILQPAGAGLGPDDRTTTVFSNCLLSDVA
jgi:hypothetical protein